MKYDNNTALTISFIDKENNVLIKIYIDLGWPYCIIADTSIRQQTKAPIIFWCIHREGGLMD